jgi:hypothetical protein
VRTVSLRAFAAIRLPDQTLGSRTIAIPLVKSPDRINANRLPDHASSWPVDRARLREDLWAVGLSMQHQARSAWDRAPSLTDALLGCDFEPWRPLMVIALLFEEAGVPHLVDHVRRVMVAYQDERADLTGERGLNRLVVEALEQMAKTAVWESRFQGDTRSVVTLETGGGEVQTRVMRVAIADVARYIHEHLLKDVDTAGDEAEDEHRSRSGWPSADQVGRAMKQLRVGKRGRSKHERWREVSETELETLIRAHGGRREKVDE